MRCWLAIGRQTPERPRVASDHIVITRIHGELLRLHILGRPYTRKGFRTNATLQARFSLCLYSLSSNSGLFCYIWAPVAVLLGAMPPLLWSWCDAPFCRHTMGFIGIDMPPCSKPHQYIFNCTLPTVQCAALTRKYFHRRTSFQSSGCNSSTPETINRCTGSVLH